MAKKTYYALRKLRLRTSTLAVASCLALSGLPLAADAAGLGKVSVFSALGQPLRAEIELSATREELSGMRAQLASAEAFRQAGLDFPTTLLGIKFAIDKRPNGASVIKLTSDRPINDPFVDMLLEINWPAGRLGLLQRKRLELARALATDPKVLLLDEIAGGLTEAEGRALVDTIRRIHRRGVSIVWIEHVLHALNAVVGRLLVLNFGRVIGVGDPQTIMASRDVREIYLGIEI